MVRQHWGFSLIELMITVMILGLLMLVGVPFTAGWIHSAQVNEVRALVVQGYGQAKAAAVRNPLGQQGTEPSASLKLVTDDDGNATLLVCAGEPEDDECDIGGGRVTWQTGLSRGTEPKLREGIAVTLNDDNNGIIEFDSVGLPTTETDFSVTKGEESVEGDLRSDKLHPD